MVSTTTAAGRVADPLVPARAALSRADWEEAARLYGEVARSSDLAEAWAGLSRASWWLGQEGPTFAARERAYRRFSAEGDVRGAAHMATWIAGDHLDFRGDDAVARAWLRRAGTLLDGLDTCSEHGWLLLMEGDVVLNADADLAETEALAREALEIAHRVGDPDVEVVALALLGTALIARGEVTEGLARVEESTALAVGGEFTDAVAPGWALCHNVTVCADLGEFGQAEQWCRAMHRFAGTWRGRHFFGSCRLAYGGVLATHGDWSSAEEELVSAREDLLSTRRALAGPSAVRLGELRVRQGRLPEARALFEEALPAHAAVLALAELDLLAGDALAAADSAQRVLRRLAEANVLERLPAMELLARAHAAAGDHRAARGAAREAAEQAGRLGTAYLLGRGRWVHAEVELAAGDLEAARTAAEDACDLFSTASAPFERAHAQLVLAAALRGLGRADRARAEEQAAHEGLALLGVRESPAAAPADRLSVRELDVLRLVAEGLNDTRIAERLFLSPHTVHRHVANIRTRLDVGSRAAAVAEATRLGLL